MASWFDFRAIFKFAKEAIKEFILSIALQPYYFLKDLPWWAKLILLFITLYICYLIYNWIKKNPDAAYYVEA